MADEEDIKIKFDEDEELEGEVVGVDDEETSEVEDTEDGGAIITFEDDDADKNLEWFANLVEEVPVRELDMIVTDLMNKIDLDKKSREKRDELYKEGLRRTGLGDDAPGGASFAGANKVVHPLLVEACVDFSARVMKEIFPSGGPARSKIIGDKTEEKMTKAENKTEFINWQLTEQMTEFRGELEQLSTQMPLGGGQYLKLMFDPDRKRAISEFVPIDDVFLPFAATNFYTAERKTHRQYVTEQEFDRRVRMGMYRDIVLVKASEPEYSEASKANDKIEGRESDPYNEDGLREIYEVDAWLDFGGEWGEGIKPYIITIDESTDIPLALYRNWEEDDANFNHIDWMAEFPFIPWRGAYPIGLTHLIGGLSGAATGALRALLDSAHIQNVPTAAKLKGGPNGQVLNLQATEIAEIDGGGVSDDIRKLIMPIPFNPPSSTLYSLLGFLVDAGKGVVQTSFEKLSDTSRDMPVGTTLALIEQGMVVFSSIHSRMHASMAMVLKILHRINSAYLTDEDIASYGDFKVKAEDFDGKIDVIPVSDPNIFSETQRFAQTQAILQRASIMPALYDARKVEEMFLRQLKVTDEILVKDEEPDNMDPASENVAAAMGAPIYVIPKQEHIAHLMVHIKFMTSTMFGLNPTIVQGILPVMVKHMRDHLLNYYLTESSKAVKMAEEKGFGDNPKKQAELINAVQNEIEQIMLGASEVINNLYQQLQQMMSQQQQPQPQQPVDNSLQVAQINAAQRDKADQGKMQLGMEKLNQDSSYKQARLQQDGAIKSAEMQQDGAIKSAEMQQDGAIKSAEMQQDGAIKSAEMQQDDKKIDVGINNEILKQQGLDKRQDKDLTVREYMNSSDNQTALQLAAAEIASGEKVAVSTGTGINPNP